MNSVFGKNFAIIDWDELPDTTLFLDGKPLRNRKLLISPFTTGEPIMVLRTHVFPTEIRKPAPTKEYLHNVGHQHEFAEEIMIYDHAAVANADGTVFDIPAGGAFMARPGCHHGSSPVDSTKGVQLNCIFTPSIPENEDPDYPVLAERTREFLKTVPRVE